MAASTVLLWDQSSLSIRDTKMGRTEKELNFQLQTQIEETNKLIQGVSLYYINWMQMTTNKYE